MERIQLKGKVELCLCLDDINIYSTLMADYVTIKGINNIFKHYQFYKLGELVFSIFGASNNKVGEGYNVVNGIQEEHSSFTINIDQEEEVIENTMLY